MTECRIGFIRHAAEIRVGNLSSDKRADHIDRDLPIRPAKKSGDGLGRKLRPRFGHVEAAVAGEPGQHHVAETQCGGLPPGRNVSRQTALQRLKVSAKPLILIEYPSLPMAKSSGTIKRFRAKWKPVLFPSAREPGDRCLGQIREVALVHWREAVPQKPWQREKPSISLFVLIVGGEALFSSPSVSLATVSFVDCTSVRIAADRRTPAFRDRYTPRTATMASAADTMWANSPLRFSRVIAWMSSAECASPSGPIRSNVQVRSRTKRASNPRLPAMRVVVSTQ